MNKLKTINFRSMPIGAHSNFIGITIAKLNNAGNDVKEAVRDLLFELTRLHVIELAVLDWEHKSDLTAKIAAANRRLDKTLSDFAAQVEAARRNYQPAVAEAAESLHNMLHRYGKIVDKAYVDEIEDVRAILRHLNGDHAARVQATGLEGWIPLITAACDELFSLIEQRNAEMKAKPEMNSTQVREAINRVYREIVEIINGGEAMQFSIHFTDFIEDFNPEIEYFNKQFNRVKKDIKDCEPAPIRDQIYTGQECEPETEVWMKGEGENKKLKKGTDFYLSYKNNVEVGNASCLIHGLGRYRGIKVITFVIVRAK